MMFKTTVVASLFLTIFFTFHKINTYSQVVPVDDDSLESKIFIVVGSDAKAVERRLLVRSWWKKQQPTKMQLRFWVRSSDKADQDILNKEKRKYNDMQIYWIDKDAITSRLFRYVLGFSRVEFVYLVKIEDDSFLHIANLLSYLKSRPSEKLVVSPTPLGVTRPDLVSNFDGVNPYILSVDVVNHASVPIFNLSTLNVTLEEKLARKECSLDMILATGQPTDKFYQMGLMYSSNMEDLCSPPAWISLHMIVTILFVLVLIIVVVLGVIRMNERVNCIPLSRKDMIMNPLARIFNGGRGVKKAY